MAYKIAWGSNHPGHLVYLVDLSGSMEWNNKIDNVIDVIADVSDYLCAMSEEFGKLKNRFSLTILGYNSDIITLFRGSVIDLDKKLQETDGRPMFDKGKEAKPEGLTYTAKAFKAAADDIRTWISQQNRNNVPTPAPIVIHITDGHPEESGRTDSEAMQEALKAAKDLKSIAVPDGNTLVFNIHIDGKPNGITMRFPNTTPNDERRRFLYEASSEMADLFSRRANAFGFSTRSDSRFMVSNESDKHILARLIAFGSSVSSVGDEPREIPKM